MPADQVASAQAEAEAFVGEMYRRVPVQDTGARAATNTFVQRGIGDVLLAWENEALLAAREMGAGLVRHRQALRQRARRAARGAHRLGRRPQRDARRRRGLSRVPVLARGPGHRGAQLLPADGPDGRARYAAQFPQMRLFTVDAVFGGWAKAQAEHFADGGIYDRLFVAASGAPPRPHERARRHTAARALGHGDGERLGEPQRAAGIRHDARFRRAVPHVHRADPAWRR